MAQQFCTFFLDGQFFGAPADNVQEVIQFQPITRVPLARPVIAGLMNVRGQIVSVLDLRRRLGMPERSYCSLPVNVVVHARDSVVSLLVDEIGDVIELPEDTFESPPATLHGPIRDVLRRIYKLPGRLLLVLDIDRLLNLENPATGASDFDREDSSCSPPEVVRRVP
ncbi:MAG TPA: chemotaxis protein CheW [Candidatus Sulfotelmatobacter sp.]|nr:chemotaxis protein CheW [Candidatus Sulfotelmatobacter sp.]